MMNNKNNPETNETYNILVIEEDEALAQLITKTLKNDKYNIECLHKGQDSIEYVNENFVNLLILDYRLSDMSGEHMIQKMRENRNDVPFIIMSIHGNEQTAVRMMKLGAADYIIKDDGFCDILPLVVDKVLENIEIKKNLYESRKILQEKETKYSALLNAVPDIMFIHDKNGVFLDYHTHGNIAFMPFENFIDKNVTDVMPHDIAQTYLYYISQTLKTSIPHVFEYELNLKDKIRYYESRFAVYGQDTVLSIARDMTEQKTAEKKLRKSEERLRLVLEGSSYGFWDWNIDTGLIQLNSRWLEMLGYDTHEIDRHIQSWQNLVHPDDYSFVMQSMNDNIVGNTEDYECEYRMKSKDGDWKWVISRGKVIDRDETGKSLRMAGIHSDITVRKNMQDEIKAALGEKETLLKEIHHRVKNNLQIISSLLYLQSNYITDKASLELFIESQNRIKSMALIHEKLYQSRDLACVDFKNYIQTLTVDLIHSFGAPPVTFSIKSDNIYFSIETAIPCGLIINELISNSLKHGFRDRRKGNINIEITQSDKEITLMVNDNGSGFARDIDFRNTKTLGMQLVNSLVTQLDGSIELNSDDGTAFIIKFKLRD